MYALISISSINETPHSKISCDYKKIDAHDLTNFHFGNNEMTTHEG